jgi:hypothetical protein
MLLLSKTYRSIAHNVDSQGYELYTHRVRSTDPRSAISHASIRHAAGPASPPPTRPRGGNRLADCWRSELAFTPNSRAEETFFATARSAGVARREIASKFDKIVAFAEVEKFSRHMDDVSHREGRTVLFVSQNMGAVRAPARKCI